MRVLICAPWFRNIARKYAAAMVEAGYDVTLVTTEAQGTRSVPPVCEEIVLPANLRSIVSWTSAEKAHAQLKRWRPDTSLLDETWDPRFVRLSRIASRRLVSVHDAAPHDEQHVRTGWKSRVERRARSSADELICFSRFTQSRLMELTGRRSTVTPLPSEISWNIGPSGAPKSELFCFVGRVSPYKGIDFLFDAWRKFRLNDSRHSLVLLGRGGYDGSIPEGVTWHNRRYDDAEAVSLIERAKAVVLPYREASQSGVQVLSMQLATPAIVTDVGALPEFQVAGTPIVRFGDVDGFTAALSLAADSSWSETQTAKIEADFSRCFGEQAVKQAILTLLETP